MKALSRRVRSVGATFRELGPLLRARGIRRGLLVAINVGTLLSAAALIVGLTAERSTTASSSSSTSSPDTPVAAPTTAAPEGGSCENGGNNCEKLPVVTAPGELGPPNTGGPGGGTDWVPAYPGSNVWIPADQITGRLFAQLPGSDVPPPDGYVEIGRTPEGVILFWLPSDFVQPPAG